MTSNSKTTDCRVKWIEICESWVVMYMGYIRTFLMFKVMLGSFGALVPKWPVAGKQMAVKQNGVKLVTSGTVL